MTIVPAMVVVLSLLSAAFAAAFDASLANRSRAAGDSQCSAKATREALVAFTRAYNSGGTEALGKLFAPEPAFQWYSTNSPGERLAAHAKRRSTLIAYFQARHARHDRFRLVSFRFNGNSRTYGNFEMRMRRRADGFRGGSWFGASGKGAAICDGETASFIVLTFGTTPRIP